MTKNQDEEKERVKITAAEVQDNEILNILHKNDLLEFKDNTQREEIGISKEQALIDFKTEYNKSNFLEKKLIQVLVLRLVESKNYCDEHSENSREYGSFEGLVFISVAEVENDFRMDYYSVKNQKITICTAEISKGIKAGTDNVSTFMHESIHAIDDLLHNEKAALEFERYLLSSDLGSEQIQKLMNYTADLIEVDKLFESAYIVPLFEKYKEKLANIINKQLSEYLELESEQKQLLDNICEKFKNSYEVNQEEKRININKLGSIKFNFKEALEISLQLKEENMPGLPYMNEYITFHFEMIFDLLKKSESAKQFKEKYREILNEFATDKTIDKEMKLHCLSLLEVTTKKMIETIIKPPIGLTQDNQELTDKGLKQALKSIIASLQEAKTNIVEIEQEKPPKKARLEKKSENLKRVEKSILSKGEDSYNFKESFYALNINSSLLNKLYKKATIEANLNAKLINLKKEVNYDKRKDKTIQFLEEDNHQTEHSNNLIQDLISKIKSGKIKQKTIIAIERKQYGENLGMRDVILLAKILEHNTNNVSKALKIPEEIKDSLIYQDAMLYQEAKSHNIRMIGIEGKNLGSKKDSPSYNQNREQYMADVIDILNRKGYNIIVNIGSSHVENIKHQLELNQQNKQVDQPQGLNKIPRHLRQEIQVIQKILAEKMSIAKSDPNSKNHTADKSPKKGAKKESRELRKNV